MTGSETTPTPDAARTADELSRFERLLSEVSSRFIDLPPDRIDEAINDGLRQMVTALGIDRSTLFNFSPRTGRLRSTHSWAAPGVAAFPSMELPQSFPWALARARAGIPVAFSRLDQLPPEAATDRASYASVGQVSQVAVPVMLAHELIAVLTFGTLRNERTWSEDLIGRMQMLGTIVASALARRRAEDRLEELLRFERLMADVSVSVAGAPAGGLDAGVNAALCAVATALAVDRCALWRLTAGTVAASATHQWGGEAAASLPDRVRAADIPWILGQITSGDIVNLAAIDDLPPAAHRDLVALRDAGVKSLLALPLRAQGGVVGALSLSCLRGERAWPDEMLPRLRMLGKLLLNALSYREVQQDAQRAAAETAQFRDHLAHLARVDAVGAMSTAVAHEVNQPLMAIKNYALAGRRRLADGAALDRDKLDGLLEKISSQAALASEVLERLRAMVKRRDAQEVEIDLAQLIGSARNLIGMEGRRKGVRFETDIAPDLPHALGDPIQVQQVILNLAHNAVEAMAATPVGERVLRFAAGGSAGDQILVRVADRGPGIAAEDQEKLYEPFYTTKETGLGVGLAICRAIVEAHGGRLWHAPNAGGGTVFQFTLPQAGA